MFSFEMDSLGELRNPAFTIHQINSVGVFRSCLDAGGGVEENKPAEIWGLLLILSGARNAEFAISASPRHM